ncbi:hypothetical protein F5Y17DRAFT_122468 [Xylariaceae sp. FL0594]|nr:hypothetical protein F5Y17DRAFT_122468 [Xylariaceae sp. FL0594]
MPIYTRRDLYTRDQAVQISSIWEYPLYYPSSQRVDPFVTEPFFPDTGPYLFHDACWNILQRVYSTAKPVPLERLLLVCRSLPALSERIQLLDWEHYYGGLLVKRDDSMARWLEPHYFDLLPDFFLLDGKSTERHDPWEIPIDDILATARQWSGLWSLQCLHLLPVQRRTHDRFSRLPNELVLMLASLMPMHDALTMRLVSGAFTALYYDRHFWSSRFKPGGDRSYLFEARGSRFNTDEMRALHRASSKSLGYFQYLAGMRLVHRKKPDIQLGYRSRIPKVVPIKRLTGLKLAVWPRGIRAVRCIQDDGLKTDWFGNMEEATTTRRLRTSTTITAIRAGFDGYKMVSLATRASNLWDESLCFNAFWSPRLPAPYLNLNEDQFTARLAATSEYRPLCWVVFGGRRGELLRQLTALSFCFDSLTMFKFYFTSPIRVNRSEYVRREISLSLESSRRRYFYIDGPGGERIIYVTVYSRSYVRSEDEEMPWARNDEEVVYFTNTELGRFHETAT